LGLAFVREVRWPLKYKGLQLDCNYRVDLLVEDAVVVELKSVEQLLPVHQAQLLTYLKASGKRVGLLINFNVPILKNGVRRLVNEYSEPLAGDAVSSPSHPQHADSQSGVSAGTIPPDRGYR